MRGLTRSLDALRAVFANPPLRNLQLCWLGSVTGEFAYTVAISIYAYRQGGAAAVGLIFLVRTIPAAAIAPFAAVLGDRFPRERIMVIGNLVRAAATFATAAAIVVEAPAASVYALSVFVALVSTLFWPAQASLLPLLARTPTELTAANTASTTLEGMGSFVGPALCGLLVAVTDVELAFAATATCFLLAGLPVVGVRTHDPAARAPDDGDGGAFLAELLGGFGAVLHEPNVALLVGLYGAWALATGALDVLLVVAAIELLDLGEGGVGLLSAAIGVGGLAGAVAALALAGRTGLARFLALGTVVWSLPIGLLGIIVQPVAAVLLLALVGLGGILIDVAGLTLLQRVVSDAVRSRVFGILEGLWVAGLGLGAVTVPALINVVGARATLVVCACVLPLATLVFWPRLAALDSLATPPLRELELIAGVPFLAPLPAPTLEQLAEQLVSTRAAAGEEIVREGDVGDRFYVIAAGEASVTARGVELATLGRGGYFGEIALLRDVPRTATVTASSDLELYALDRADFLGAVTGYAASVDEADRVVHARLTGISALRRTI